VGEAKRQVLAVDTSVNCIFIVDILLNFFSMYVDHHGELVKSPKTIACHYLKKIIK